MRLVSTVAAAVLALAFAPAAVPPASATGTGELAFAGTMSFRCFGCGTSYGTADLTLTGGYGTVPMVARTAHADFTDVESGGVDCVITSSAWGTITGAVNLSFYWTSVGAYAVMGTTGDIDGSGFTTFTITSPVGVPCGGPVTAQITGVLAGTSTTAPIAAPECSDGIDNDLDGRTDYPADPGCTDPGDTSESSDGQAACTAGPVCVQVVQGGTYQAYDVRDESGAGSAHTVRGRVDTYQFALPVGGTMIMPCVFLSADAAAVNPCALAGGTYVNTIATLVDRQVAEPAPGGVVRTVRICSATLTATVLGFGVRDVPTYTVC
jgi:hypothetical protein